MGIPNVYGAYELLRRAMQQNAQQQEGDGSSQNDPPAYNGNPQGGLLGKLLALQAQRGLPPQAPETNNQALTDPNFRQLSRVAPVSTDEAPVPIPVQNRGSDLEVQRTQFPGTFLPEIFSPEFFARPPVSLPKQLRPIEQVPRGSANGPRAGMRFPRSGPPDIYPECMYCMEETGPGNHHNDHIVPKLLRGDGAETNRADACKRCNLSKGRKTVEEWYDWVKRMWERGKEMNSPGEEPPEQDVPEEDLPGEKT